MKIIKRNGEEVLFDVEKIENAVRKANVTVPETERLSEEQIKKIGAEIQFLCENGGHEASVEEIQDFVETKIMEAGAFSIAKKYITYRYQHELNRKENSTDRQILSLLECNNGGFRAARLHGGRSFQGHHAAIFA